VFALSKLKQGYIDANRQWFGGVHQENVQMAAICRG